MYIPLGFRSITANAGIRDAKNDLTIVISEVPATLSAMFTQSRFAGPSVTLSRSVLDKHSAGARGVIVIARNANVATGQKGLANAEEVRDIAARVVGVNPDKLLIASTGVIGRHYPMQRIRDCIQSLKPPLPSANFPDCATAMMTTDTVCKYTSQKVGDAALVGIAKGVGMIEPNMATLLTFFFTDALISREDLNSIFRRVVDKTFNALSIDTDTSTSDTAAIWANGLSGPVDLNAFEQALYTAALDLTRKIAADGEGASKLIEVHVCGARDNSQAKRVAKAVVNSPLVKTAVYGSDPNWGRVTMAIGKCEDEYDIVPDKVRISFGDVEVYPSEIEASVLSDLTDYLNGSKVIIGIDLGICDGAFIAYGCDLTEGYININAKYTT